MNPNFFGNILDEPLRLENRVIMSHDAAKRLCLHLMASIQNYESRYGTIELDVTKRLKPQQGSRRRSRARRAVGRFCGRGGGA